MRVEPAGSVGDAASQPGETAKNCEDGHDDRTASAEAPEAGPEQGNTPDQNRGQDRVGDELVDNLGRAVVLEGVVVPFVTSPEGNGGKDSSNDGKNLPFPAVQVVRHIVVSRHEGDHRTRKGQEDRISELESPRLPGRVEREPVLDEEVSQDHRQRTRRQDG